MLFSWFTPVLTLLFLWTFWLVFDSACTGHLHKSPSELVSAKQYSSLQDGVLLFWFPSVGTVLKVLNSNVC